MLVLRFFIGFINYLIVYKSPVDTNTIRTDLIITMAFLYDFSTIQKDHKRWFGRVFNVVMIIVACSMVLMFLAGFLEPLFGSMQYPVTTQHGQNFITSLTFNVPYRLVVNVMLFFAMGSLFESILLLAHENGMLLRKKTDVTDNTEQSSSDAKLVATAAAAEQAAANEGGQ